MLSGPGPHLAIENRKTRRIGGEVAIPILQLPGIARITPFLDPGATLAIRAAHVDDLDRHPEAFFETGGPSGILGLRRKWPDEDDVSGWQIFSGHGKKALVNGVAKGIPIAGRITIIRIESPQLHPGPNDWLGHGVAVEEASSSAGRQPPPERAFTGPRRAADDGEAAH